MLSSVTGSSTLSAPGEAPRSTWIAVLLLTALVAISYFNCLHGELVWDDVPTIMESKSIEHFTTMLDRPAEPNTASGRPLLSLSLAINYALSGRNRVALHLTNVLIHLVGALTLFSLARGTAMLPSNREKFGKDSTWLALCIAGLWAAHPLQTEAVTYVVQRAELLMGVAYLLTLSFFVRGLGSARPAGWQIASVLTCAAGMGAKEVMVSAPLIVLFFDAVFVAGTARDALRARKFYYAGLACTWIFLGYLVVSLGGNRGGTTGGFSRQSAWLPYWTSQFHAIAVYLKLTLFPHPLVFQYGPEWPTRARDVLPYAAIVAPLILGTLYLVFRAPRIGFFAFWFFCVLAPTSLVPGTSDMIVEHRMYLALVPVLTLLVVGVYSVSSRTGLGILGALTLAFAGLSFSRNTVYRTSLALWEDNAAKRPDFALGQYNLGAILLQARTDRSAEAIDHLEKAVQLLPNFPRAHFNLAIALSKKPERIDDAASHYQYALQLQPTFPEACNNLGVLLQERGLIPQAIQQFKTAIQQKPDFEEAHENLARALVAAEDSFGAIAEYEQLLQRVPTSSKLHYDCGSILANTGQIAAAIPHLEAALRLDPNSVESKYLLGLLLMNVEGRASEAVTLLRQVAAEKSDYAEVHFYLGNALARFSTQFPEAVSEFEQALRLKPSYAEAHFNAAVALESIPGRDKDAVAHYRDYLRFEPRNPEAHVRLARLLADDPTTTAEARSEILAALRLNPDHPEARALFEVLH